MTFPSEPVVIIETNAETRYKKKEKEKVVHTIFTFVGFLKGPYDIIAA